MKRGISHHLFALFTFLYFFATPSFASTYTLDPNHSYVEWSVSHFGFSHDTGKFYLEGVISGDLNNPTHAGTSVVIPIKTLSTGLKDFDTLLLGRNFFDEEHYPNAFFRSSKIELTGNNTAKLYGTLTLRNTWAPLILDVKLVKHDINEYYHKDAISFSGTGSLNRSDFGILAYLPGVSDRVDINFEIEAILSNQ